MTSNAERLRELANRVEALSGPDPTTELAIYQAITGKDGVVRCQGREGISTEVPAYTAALDAAMTLAPAGYGCVIHPTSAEVRHPLRPLLDGSSSRCATPSLALTAACLRALAQGTPHAE